MRTYALQQILEHCTGHRWNGRLLFSLRQRLRDFAGAVDEKPRDGAERAALQGDDSDWHAGHWQFNGQDLQFRVLGGKLSMRKPEISSESARSPADSSAREVIGDDSRAGIIKPAGVTKASIAIDPIPLPGGDSTHGSFTSSASSILRRRTQGDRAPAATTHGSSKRNSKPRVLVFKGAEFACDQKVDATLTQFTV